ncbi:EAL domain-containing protein, partial [Metabacillus sp. YM-086]|uniref:EAL domain-containing protein n=1 Tax=Metabacillus sp. YM-086 TaxID=3341729 RepID=UPI003A83A3D3
MSIEDFINEEKFFHHFQPIYYLKTGNILGYEVLLRSNMYSNPEYVIQEAIKEKKLYELDSGSIHKAISTYNSAGLSKKDGKLFLNILPSTILNSNFPYFINKIIAENYLSNQEFILEISESENIQDFDTFKTRILELKKQGFFIAIDDIGHGYCNLKTIIELEPDYLKLDRYFSQDLKSSKQKQSLISFFLNYCQEYKSQLILEGLENEMDMEMAKSLG